MEEKLESKLTMPPLRIGEGRAITTMTDGKVSLHVVRTADRELCANLVTTNTYGGKEWCALNLKELTSLRNAINRAIDTLPRQKSNGTLTKSKRHPANA